LFHSITPFHQPRFSPIPRKPGLPDHGQVHYSTGLIESRPESSRRRPPSSSTAGGGGPGGVDSITFPLVDWPLIPQEEPRSSLVRCHTYESITMFKKHAQTWMMAAAWPLSWSDLPQELLGLVLKRLPSLPDRVRLRAVCHPWRFNAQLQPLPPPLPWLSLLDGTFLSIPDGEIIRMPVPDGSRCCGSIDNWLFLIQSDGRYSLMNPFSKAMMDLPNLDTVWHSDWYNASDRFKPLFYKMVVPSPLDLSPDSVVAVLIADDGNGYTVCICQPPIATDLVRGRYRDPLYLLDEIEFFDGKLYCTVFGDKLFQVEIADGLESKGKIASIQCVINSVDHFNCRPKHLADADATFGIRKYLVKCVGRLLMVERWSRNMAAGRRPGPPDYLEHDRTVAFQVFEADLSTNPGQWVSVNKLDGQALFVGQHCSKSFPAEKYNGIQENCIYFMCDYPRPECAADPLRDSGVYNITNGVITPLLFEAAAVPRNRGGQWRPTWFFPAESV
ncbi:hypothetical protein EJB05_46261, partial [Eragrostis curvula]